MLRRLILTTVLLLVTALPLRADPGALTALAEVLEIDRLIAVLRQEGETYGEDLEAELFPGAGGARWTAIVAQIHDADRMRAIFLDRLAQDLAGREAELGRITAFFSDGLGRKIVGLELAAREALLDDTVKDAAELVYEDMQAANDPRLPLVLRFAQVNDLIETNVAGALNSNIAFYRGMIEGGALDPVPDETEMMADLWSQEQQVREDTETWLYPYLVMAYQPLTDAELEAYTGFSETADGKVLNSALFAAFDAMFSMLSEELGFAAARYLQGQDI